MSISCWSDCWDSAAGGKPVSEVGHADFSESYEMDQMHVFQLDNGKYAVVYESGCSCYESSSAEVEILPFARAFEKYIQYKKDNGGTFTNLEYLEMKSQEKENESLSKNNDPKASS